MFAFSLHKISHGKHDCRSIIQPQGQHLYHCFILLSDAAQGWLESVGDEVDVEVGVCAADNHDVILYGHGKAKKADVAVGGIDQVVDFLLCDGLHGVVAAVKLGTCLDFNDVQPIGGGLMGDDVNLEMPHAPVGLANGVSLADEELTGGLLSLFSQFVVLGHFLLLGFSLFCPSVTADGLPSDSRRGCLAGATAAGG